MDKGSTEQGGGGGGGGAAGSCNYSEQSFVFTAISMS